MPSSDASKPRKKTEIGKRLAHGTRIKDFAEHFVLRMVFGFFLGILLYPDMEPLIIDNICNRERDNSFLSAVRILSDYRNISDPILDPRTNAILQPGLHQKDAGASDDNFLFIGIMTARKFLDTRARASHMTWVPKVPGKVVYFLGEGEEYTGELNVVILRGVYENDYPPQKKSFAMIEYIQEHYAKHFKWVMRSDDDLYINVEPLVQFLRSIHDGRPLYLGQPGFGTVREIGKLGLSGAFCMGGPGVIMTSQLVQAVAPALKNCLQDTTTEHEDTELGRCITATTGVQCTVNYQMKEFFVQNPHDTDPNLASFNFDLGDREKGALTMHSFKRSPYVYRMHNFIQMQKIKKLQEKILILARDTELPEKETQDLVTWHVTDTSEDTKDEVPPESLSYPYDPGMEDTLNDKPETASPEVTIDPYANFPVVWETIRSKSLFSPILETNNLLSLPAINLRKKELQDDLEKELSARAPNGRKTLYMGHSYQRLRPIRGAEAMFFRKRWIKGQRQVGPTVVRRSFRKDIVDFTETRISDDKTIHMLLTLYTRSAKYKRFLDSYVKAVHDFEGKVVLHVVIFRDDNAEEKLISAMTFSVLNSNPNLDIRVIHVSEAWNKGRGIMYALSDLPYTSLVLQMDVDMEFDAGFLRRVVRNTELGKSAYFPVVFAHYNPQTVCSKEQDCDSLLATHQNKVGLWKIFGLGMVSIYKKDLLRVGGYRQDIKGWGYEDVDFYEKCVQSYLTVIRTADPGITHRYHSRTCNPSLPEAQLIQCRGSADDLLGSVRHLYWMLHQKTNGTEG